MRPLREYSTYSVAKAGLIMLTKSLARELAPQVRVNGIAPGPVMWPEDGLIDAAAQQKILARTPCSAQGPRKTFLVPPFSLPSMRPTSPGTSCQWMAVEAWAGKRGHTRPELADRLTGHRVAQVCRDVGERSKHVSFIEDIGMRQRRHCADLIAIQ